ncbi:hypothetical protein DPE44_07940 [Salmonella enterica subsp. salamae]|nr:hypothetical protein [Salmonella enterica subsp. salamae]
MYISVVAIIYLFSLLFISENSFLFILGVLPLFFLYYKCKLLFYSTTKLQGDILFKRFIKIIFYIGCLHNYIFKTATVIGGYEYEWLVYDIFFGWFIPSQKGYKR